MRGLPLVLALLACRTPDAPHPNPEALADWVQAWATGEGFQTVR